MACYCQYCRFLYPAGTPICYTCGRPTSRDNLSVRDYLGNGYQAMGAVEKEENRPDKGNARQVFREEGTAMQSAASVFQGENVSFETDQNEYGNRQENAFSEAEETVNRELETMEQLQAERNQQIRALRRSRRWQRIRAILISLPWRHFFRFLLIVLIVVLLITAWNMRHVILSGITSFIIALLPLIFLIYLLISMFRGHF